MIQIFRSKYEHIFNFTIYGERHSGTNFLEECIKAKFNLPITYFHGFKHWFGFAKPERINYDRHTLFIGIVRNPYNWLSAFYSAPHHVPKQNTLNFDNFLNNEWYSINYHNKEILEDRNYTTKPNPIRYKNIFQLRKEKCLYLSHIMPVIASNYILMSYEGLLYNHHLYLNIIQQRFNLKTFGQPPEVLEKPDMVVSEPYKTIIDSNLDWSIENGLGYFRR